MRVCAEPTQALIVNSPCVIKAWLGDDGLLTVYRSSVVQDVDLPKKIKNMLNNREHRIVFAEAFEDDDMLFGEGILSVYRFIN